MPYHPATFAKAMTAIAAVLAFSSTPLYAQDAGTPPVPDADTTVEPSATSDPLAPEAAPEATPSATDTTIAAPPAPKPKVEASRATTRARASAAATTQRSTPRRVTATPPATVTVAPATPAPETAAPAPPVEPLPAVTQATAEPTAPPIAEPTPASEAPDLMADDMLPIAGAAALGLLAVGAAGIAMHRRRRRREYEEFEARQRLLDQLEAEHEAQPPERELDRSAEVRPGPAFVRASTPKHDPVPERTAFVARPQEARPDTDFLIRRAGGPAEKTIKQD